MNDLLLRLAKLSIKDALEGKNSIDKSTIISLYPELNEQRATFVTINLEGKLRGCIGSLVAHRALFDDIILNAKSAAFKDPRFNPLTKEEFSKIEVELSILTPAYRLEYSDIEDLRGKINVGEDGVVLKHHSKQATYLPQVWEQLPTFDAFFSSLCMKAGLEPKAMFEHPEIFVYKAQKIK